MKLNWWQLTKDKFLIEKNALKLGMCELQKIKQ